MQSEKSWKKLDFRVNLTTGPALRSGENTEGVHGKYE